MTRRVKCGSTISGWIRCRSPGKRIGHHFECPAQRAAHRSEARRPVHRTAVRLDAFDDRAAGALTSFEDEPPWNQAYKQEIDKPYRPWYPDGSVHLANIHSILKIHSMASARKKSNCRWPIPGLAFRKTASIWKRNTPIV